MLILVQLATDTTDFIERPVGRCLVARTFLFWCATPTLRGWSLWGRPLEDDVDRLIRVMDDHSAMRIPFDVVHDVRHLESVDSAAFDLFSTYVRSHLARDVEEIRRHAIVRGGGLAGAIAAGFNFVFEAQQRWQAFTNLREAFRWLGSGEVVCAEIESLLSAAMTPSPVLGQLRAYLAVSLVRANVVDAAPATGSSVRTLQRALKNCGTSFSKELDRARVREAARLLADSTAACGDLGLR